VFRRGFVGKVQRTSVVQHYGVKTLLYGTLLPGPHIGKRNGAILRDIASRGFEVGVHTYDHTKWQDHVAHADAAWTRRELVRAQSTFVEIFGFQPIVHGAAGWQMNAHVPRLEHEMGFRYASDTRGAGPFLPVIQGVVGRIPQLPTTLPTLDELLGRTDLSRATAMEELLAIATEVNRDHVFTLHAELEGGRYLSTLENLVKGWRDCGYELGDLGAQFGAIDPAQLPVHEIISGTVPGRAGKLAVQGLKSGAR
jgi:peptidoglycan/xylan/chitin deacetylase (PgdA/CDA1 family)